MRLSAITALCPLPSQLSALVALCSAIDFSDATANGRSSTDMSKNACPHLVPPRPCEWMHLQPPIKVPPLQPFSPIPGSILDLYYISYKRQHGSACVLARCGIQSSRIFAALWPTCVVLSRYVSSPVAFDWLPLRVRRGPRGLPLPRIFMFLGA